MSAADPLEKVLVAYGPTTVQDIEVHENGRIEAVTTREVRVFEKQADGSLKELFGEAKDNALDAFWADVAAFNELNDINGGND
ncbi:hypothetical protein JK361_09985 [Streptomyces sp. 5-8]|uniref:Uncharacterized protein n=1 Tax=Streptomyces musisoli TaxID=2802280 RepID=A0ABS1NY27_9ACTN|nr:hypothetical protein [Streptomyces musisoli]MBL1104919.1 hypothetical protein [Streptomyces musisoli]